MSLNKKPTALAVGSVNITIKKLEIERPPVIGSRRADYLIQKRLADSFQEKDEKLRQKERNSYLKIRESQGL
jgi:hypothetical protein